MPITEQDIKLLASQRMTDTSDGGGRMTGNVVQSGVDNNIFDDVSNLDRVYGNVSLRKVFAAVLTPDTDKYLGARVIIDQPPADPNVHALLFDASSTFDNRADVSVKVESYLAQGVAFTGALFGDHLVGQTALMIQRAEGQPAPAVGDVLVLVKLANTASEARQYVRITTSSSEVATFTDAEGRDYKLRLCACGISDPLREFFAGWGPIKGGIATSDMLNSPVNAGRAMLHESVVADAAQYFGIRPLETAATTGAFSIKADTAYSPLLPSAQIETPIADARTNGLSEALAAAGGPVTQTLTVAWSPTQSLFIGGAVLPGSLSVTSGAVNVVDNNGRLLMSGAEVGAVDYANGILSLSTAVGGSTYTVTYVPATAFTTVGKSVGIPISINNRSLSYVLTLQPLPAKGSLSASYLAGGRWYTLRDGGTGALSASDPSLGVGTLNSTTGTLILTLGALPDVGGAVVLQWSEASQVLDNTNTVLRYPGKAWALLTTSGTLGGTSGDPIAPGTLELTWNDGTARSATDDGNGILGGDATGVVDYQAGLIYFAPNTLPPKDTVVSLVQESLAAATASYAMANSAAGAALTFELAMPPSVAPGSVRFGLTALVQLLGYYAKDARLTIADNGSGSLLATGTVGVVAVAVAAGTINYASGLVSVSIAASAFPAMDWVGQQNSYVSGGGGNVWGASGAWLATQVATSTAVPDYLYPFQGNVSVSSVNVTPVASPKSVQLSALNLQVANTATGFSLSGVGFALGGRTYKGLTTGTLVHSISPTTGSGTPAGNVVPALGVVNITDWAAGQTNALSNWRGVLAPPADGADSLSADASLIFRTAAANIRPGSFQLLGTMADGTAISLTADAGGNINATRVKGRINYASGLVELLFVNPAPTDLGTFDASYLGIVGVGTVNLDVAQTASLRYNAVAYSYLPLDAAILGLDAVRLPQDGRVPIFKAGRVVVIHNTQSMAPATVSNGQTLDTSRPRLARVRVLGADGDPITTGWTADLDAGTVTFTNVSGYSQPVTVEHRIEDEALCAEAQITGDLRLTRPLTHDYPAPGTYVSSAMIAGTKQAAAGEGFSQTAWTAEWSDTAIGNPITAQYNQTLHPIVVANQGAIEERWALIFNNSTTFRVVGKASGEILVSNTGEVCAPLNPATGVPYFSIAPGGWGVGWAAGNVLRFNTRAANWPIWVSRTVLQSPAAPAGTDQIVISVRGDVDA